MATVLIIEDEQTIAENIIYALNTEGFKTWHCINAHSAREYLKQEEPDIILLDVGLPDESGFEFAKFITANTDIPVIFVTARSDEMDRILGLELGGDDYVVKPFSPRELTSRIKAVLRRVNSDNKLQDNIYKYGEFLIESDKLKVKFKDKSIDLSRYEFKIFELLIKNPGRVFSRERIMNRIWEDPAMTLERTVDAHIKTIRHKIREIDSKEEYIITHRGSGYSFNELTLPKN